MASFPQVSPPTTCALLTLLAKFDFPTFIFWRLKSSIMSHSAV
jgi:hypothetical protein